MSSQRLRSTNARVDLSLNIQGSAFKQPSNDEKLVSHSPCIKEIDKLKRELSSEKSNSRKLKASLSKFQSSMTERETSHKNALSSLEERYEKERQELKEMHASTLITLSNKHKEEMKILEQKYRHDLEEKKTNELLEISNQLENLKVKHECELACKQKHIETLKGQVKDSLESNSKERQEQIDELLKELNRVSDEADYYKMISQRSVNSNCGNCTSHENKYKEVLLELAKYEENYKGLVNVCSKMENQLSQQDELCMMLASLKSNCQK